MWEESSEQPKPLRTGLTTGTCATACSIAAARELLRQNSQIVLSSNLPGDRNSSLVYADGSTSAMPSDVHLDKPTAADPKVSHAVVISVTLPKGKTVELQVDCMPLVNADVSALKAVEGTIHRASTIKDAGDDPDVTHGARVFVDIQLNSEPGVQFFAGAGVGTVTRDGLALAIGEPAINPVPRQMIQQHLQQLAVEYNYVGGFRVAVGIENGANIALKTMNPRLGIVGGLSVLGTSGIVRPFSCAAWIASIHQAIDVAGSNGFDHIAASTGNASELAIKNHYQLADMALIEMGDFAGAVLKHLKRQPLRKLSLCGGFGKITKLAQGHMDLHSRASSIDFDHIADIARQAGANTDDQQHIRQANTSIEALKWCQQRQIPLADAMCHAAWLVCRDRLPKAVEVEVWAINRQGEFVGFSDGRQ